MQSEYWTDRGMPPPTTREGWYAALIEGARAVREPEFPLELLLDVDFMCDVLAANDKLVIWLTCYEHSWPDNDHAHASHALMHTHRWMFTLLHYADYIHLMGLKKAQWRLLREEDMPQLALRLRGDPLPSQRIRIANGEYTFTRTKPQRPLDNIWIDLPFELREIPEIALAALASQPSIIAELPPSLGTEDFVQKAIDAHPHVWHHLTAAASENYTCYAQVCTREMAFSRYVLLTFVTSWPVTAVGEFGLSNEDWFQLIRSPNIDDAEWAFHTHDNCRHLALTQPYASKLAEARLSLGSPK